jgi:hypothetical protein
MGTGGRTFRARTAGRRLLSEAEATGSDCCSRSYAGIAPGTNAGVWEAESVRVVLLVITSQASGSWVLEIHNLFAQLVMFTEQRLQRVCGR